MNILHNPTLGETTANTPIVMSYIVNNDKSGSNAIPNKEDKQALNSAAVVVSLVLLLLLVGTIISDEKEFSNE